MNMQRKTYNIIKRTIVLFTVLVCSSGLVYAQEKADALRLYRTGRSLDSVGRSEEAKASYTAAVDICLTELRHNPRNMDSYTVYTWSLFRLHRYRETVTACTEALKIASDVRIIETLGEAYFYLNDYKESLRQREHGAYRRAGKRCLFLYRRHLPLNKALPKSRHRLLCGGTSGTIQFAVVVPARPCTGTGRVQAKRTGGFPTGA